MNFALSVWKEEDFAAYYAYRDTTKGSDQDCQWEQRIIGTALPCYGRTTAKARELAKTIAKGNYLSFLDGIAITTYFDSVVVGDLVCRIADFATFTSRLDAYMATVDNWAACDGLHFRRHSTQDLLALSSRYRSSSQPFVRRVGVNIWFTLIKHRLFDEAFAILDTLSCEQEYYVNMSAAWLLCECFVQDRDATMAYFAHTRTNDFVVNKAISKCRDSYRVSPADKAALLAFRRV